PFDEDSGTVPHEGGRVEPGVYVAGWIKRGPTGFIGTNKTCAHETVESLLDDFAAGRLTPPAAGTGATADALGLDAWRAIDRAERAAGAAQGRPRVKFTDAASLRRAA
ncbi:4Fe-4S ferredoxin, partial [Streptomyces sp. SID5785]|nr:4Fe-4S ferredoxin [Streptomyces sp. SID5785]